MKISEKQLRKLIREVSSGEPVRVPLNIPLPADLMDIHKRMKMGGRGLYLVGGAVRDALLGKTPDDYDLATEADPDRVIKILQRDSTLRIDLTGKSFGVVRVKTPAGEEYEIATFRKDIGGGRRPDAVEWTGIEEDANRRDLTVNALYYDLETKEVVDFIGGIEDVKNGVIRTVGDPVERFDEDRLRILRVPRFAARMGSEIDKETVSAILEDNELIDVPPERIKEEVLKAIKQAVSVQDFFIKLEQLQLIPQIFPGLSISSGNIDDSSREPPVVLGQALIDNDSPKIKRALTKMAFSNAIVDQTDFLVNFSHITPQDAPILKKVFKRLKMQPEMLDSFAGAKTVEAFKKLVSSPPAADARELMAQGITGPALGKALASAESEAYTKFINEVRKLIREIIR